MPPLTLNRFSNIDLSVLPVPQVIETLSYENVLEELKLDFQSRYPVFDMAGIEAEPVVKLLEVTAYRVLIERARVNSAASAVLLAYAQKTDLDNLGALFGVDRLLVTPENLTTFPIIEAVYEDDESFRRRIQLSIEAYSSAGPYGAYTFFALSGDGRVKDVNVVGPESGLVTPGEVAVYVLSKIEPGTPTADILTAVLASVDHPERRPLTDKVYVRSATIVPYTVSMELLLNPGADPTIAVNTALASVKRYTESRHRVGLTVHRAGLAGSAFLPEMVLPNTVNLKNPVEDVIVTNPPADITPGANGAAYVTDADITITYRIARFR